MRVCARTICLSGEGLRRPSYSRRDSFLAHLDGQDAGGPTDEYIKWMTGASNEREVHAEVANQIRVRLLKART